MKKQDVKMKKLLRRLEESAKTPVKIVGSERLLPDLSRRGCDDRFMVPFDAAGAVLVALLILLGGSLHFSVVWLLP
jgi:hypothetical protein